MKGGEDMTKDNDLPLAVVMAVFLGAVAAGVVTLVAGFLAIPNVPAVPQAPAAIAQAG